MKNKKPYVLIIGSAPSAVVAQNWNLTLFNKVIAINNAWKITPEWTNSIFPEDFPMVKRPKPKRNQSIQLKGLRALGHTPAEIRASLSRSLGGPDTDNIEKMVKSFTWEQLPTTAVPWSLNNSL